MKMYQGSTDRSNTDVIVFEIKDLEREMCDCYEMDGKIRIYSGSEKDTKSDVLEYMSILHEYEVDLT